MPYFFCRLNTPRPDFPTTMIDAERQVIVVAFRWRNRQVQLEASWKGYAQAWVKQHPWKRGSRVDHDRKALDIGRVAVCSVLRDWVKGQTTAVECGIMSFEAAFMPLSHPARPASPARRAIAVMLFLMTRTPFPVGKWSSAWDEMSWMPGVCSTRWGGDPRV